MSHTSRRLSELSEMLRMASLNPNIPSDSKHIFSTIRTFHQPIFRFHNNRAFPEQGNRKIATMAASKPVTSFHSKHSNMYDRMASNCTYSVAVGMLPYLSPITSTSYVLDNACGTGLVTSLLKSHYPNLRVLGTDVAPGMISVYNSKIADNNWSGSVSSSICDSRALTGIKDESFSHVITNFGFPPDLTDMDSPMKAAREMWRVMEKGGMAVVSIWKERHFTNAIEATARRIRPNEEPYSWTMHSEWSDAGWLQKTIADAGFGEDVIVKQIDGAVSAESLEELVGNMMCGKEMFFKGYSEEEFARVDEVLGEELKRLEAFYENNDGVGIRVESWVAFATK
ncbi:hypothetical protein VTL71DRAFT_597 [Oculimacula yallundae]|uniref:Methyltransferase domain-containing protein n=1 Tax=Oculimacula yallundae TaxID=86028 RepID=A0ABR4D0H5_9HELO